MATRTFKTGTWSIEIPEEGEPMKQKEQELTSQQLLGNLIKVGHKSLEPYKADGLRMVQLDPNLYAHLIAWNQENGEIRDSKVALPIIALRGSDGPDGMFHDNAVAHLLLLDPRNLLRAVRYNKELNGISHKTQDFLKFGVSKYLRVREADRNWWDRTTLQHRDSMKNLYRMFRFHPNARAQAVLFDQKYPRGSVFEALKELKNMESREAAGTILNFKIPFLMAIGALGGAAKNTEVVLALIESMSSTELITNTKMLERLGVMDNPALKAAYNNGIAKAKGDKKAPTMKAARAKEFVTDEKVKAKLEAVTEAKVRDLKGMEGDWLVLGDRSGSMEKSIEKAKEVASYIAHAGKGKVYLVFFNTEPSNVLDVTGLTLDHVKNKTRGIIATGGTNIGCGLDLVAEKGLIINGVVIVSDGADHSYQSYSKAMARYEKKFDFAPNTYLLHLPGEPDSLSAEMKAFPNFGYQKMEAEGLDYYSMPNLINMLRSSRYTLMDEIMEASLLTVKEVIDGKK